MNHVRQGSKIFLEPEKPVHTVFITNIPFTVESKDIQKFASQFGEISSLYGKNIRNKGIAFATFYDIRSAIKAVEEGNSCIMEGRPLRVSFAFKSPDHHKRNPEDICSAITVISQESKTNLNVDDIKEEFAKYGEIRECQSDKRDGEFSVKYYDLRSARTVIGLGKIQIKNEELRVSYDEEDEGIPAPPKEDAYSLEKENRMSSSRRNERSDKKSDQNRSFDRRDFGSPPGYPLPFYNPGYPPGYMNMPMHGYPMIPPGFVPPVYPFSGYPYYQQNQGFPPQMPSSYPMPPSQSSYGNSSNSPSSMNSQREGSAYQSQPSQPAHPKSYNAPRQSERNPPKISKSSSPPPIINYDYPSYQNSPSTANPMQNSPNDNIYSSSQSSSENNDSSRNASEISGLLSQLSSVINKN